MNIKVRCELRTLLKQLGPPTQGSPLIIESCPNDSLFVMVSVQDCQPVKVNGQDLIGAIERAMEPWD